MRKPADTAIDIAILWLRSYESDGSDQGEAAIKDCEDVAKWLEHGQEQAALREAARDGGVPVSALRRKMKELARGQ